MSERYCSKCHMPFLDKEYGIPDKNTGGVLSMHAESKDCIQRLRIAFDYLVTTLKRLDA